LFSHYPYFDRLVEKMLGDNFTNIRREAWIWMQDRYVPYPFQNNIRHLAKEDVLACLTGLIAAQREQRDSETFEEWINATFGAGIARVFMLPYNFKVWATPARLMSKQWMGERVSVVDVERVLRNVVSSRTTRPGGRTTLQVPASRRHRRDLSSLRPVHRAATAPGKAAVAVDLERKTVEFDDGTGTSYDVLISTMPLDLLVASSREAPSYVREAATRLVHNSSYIVSVGVARPNSTTKCWMYYPEDNTPFYRVTYLSNYSPHMTPDKDHFLLLAETTHSPWKPEPKETIVQRVIDGWSRPGS
jgi:protoporphyrinogen oxidase